MDRDIDPEALVRLDLAGAPEPPPDARTVNFARKGRGATFNPPVRFDKASSEAFDDGWNTLAAEFGELPPLPTTLSRDASRSVIAYNTSPDIGFDRAVNPHRGCEHGCIYCYARPTHAYLGLSPGLDFETKLLFKPRSRNCWRRNSASPATCRARWRSVPIPIPTSPSNAR